MSDDPNARRFVLWGSKGHALVLEATIRLVGGRVVALFDNDPQAQPVLQDVPLYIGDEGLASFLSQGPVSDLSALVAIGRTHCGARRSIQEVLSLAGFQIPTLIHPRAYVCDTAKIGAGCQVLGHATVAAAAWIGDACIVNHGAIVDHECRLGAGTHVAPGSTLCGCVETGTDVFIGAGATVLPRVRIGAGAMIGAGAVVTRDVPDGTVVAGAPARLFPEQKDRGK